MEWQEEFSDPSLQLKREVTPTWFTPLIFGDGRAQAQSQFYQQGSPSSKAEMAGSMEPSILPKLWPGPAPFAHQNRWLCYGSGEQCL